MYSKGAQRQSITSGSCVALEQKWVQLQPSYYRVLLRLTHLVVMDQWLANWLLLIVKKAATISHHSAQAQQDMLCYLATE